MIVVFKYLPFVSRSLKEFKDFLLMVDIKLLDSHELTNLTVKVI